MKIADFVPLVGILASKGGNNHIFRGDATVFKNIQRGLSKFGGQSFVFTTDDVEENGVIGYVYFFELMKWGKISFPFPDIIYNKISSRSEETSDEVVALKTFFEQQRKPFFNYGFFDKWETYSALSQDKEMQSYLPKTWLFTDKINISDLLKSHYSLYAKPKNGHKGSGIYKLSRKEDHYMIQSNSTTITYNEEKFRTWVSNDINRENYLLQEEIMTDKIDDCKYDLRVICLYRGNEYKPIGIGVRKATKNSFMTHVPNGGEIIPFEQVKDRCSINQIYLLANKVGTILTKAFGFVGEFSLDIGITSKGWPFLFEVNSKPMIFDEREIQNQRITELVQLFIELEKYHK
jgi:glutathione synthase/RimK-type ligase-like ATP-grasp enzyme